MRKIKQGSTIQSNEEQGRQLSKELATEDWNNDIPDKGGRKCKGPGEGDEHQ